MGVAAVVGERGAHDEPRRTGRRAWSSADRLYAWNVTPERAWGFQANRRITRSPVSEKQGATSDMDKKLTQAIRRTRSIRHARWSGDNAGSAAQLLRSDDLNPLSASVLIGTGKHHRKNHLVRQPEATAGHGDHHDRSDPTLAGPPGTSNLGAAAVGTCGDSIGRQITGTNQSQHRARTRGRRRRTAAGHRASGDGGKRSAEPTDQMMLTSQASGCEARSHRREVMALRRQGWATEG